LICCNVELTEDVWPPTGIARQISVSSDQLDSSYPKQSGTNFTYSVHLHIVNKHIRSTSCYTLV